MRKFLFLALFIFSFLKGFNQSLPLVKIEILIGDIVVELDTIDAPITAKNFLKLVESGIMDNAVFYRVIRMDNQPKNKIKIEVIQGGLF